MMDNNIPIWTESIHCATYLGEAVDQVPRSKPVLEGKCPACNLPIAVQKNKKPENTCPLCKVKINTEGFDTLSLRSVTTADMVKYGLFPSVTRIVGYPEMDFSLSAWAKGRALKYIAKYTIENRQEDTEKWLTSVLATIGPHLKEMEDEFADAGSFIHGCICKALEGLDYPHSDIVDNCVEQVKGWIVELGGKVRAEAHHCNPELGLSGTIDLDLLDLDVINDWKAKFNPKTYAAIVNGKARSYLKPAARQLAGYGLIRARTPQDYYVTPINAETGDIFPIKLTVDEIREGERFMKSHIQAFFDNIGYDPRQMYKEGQCWSYTEILAGKKG